MSERAPGQVTIAPEVLVTIVQLSVQNIPGVYAMTTNWTRDVNRFFGDARVGDGVQIQVRDDQVTIDLYVVVDRQVTMLQLARRIQQEVARAVKEMTGMGVQSINVHITEVYYPQTSSIRPAQD
ncbi:MAG: Asp23/Gls24 family envelope stress response protein [Anaerolineae bacterium]|nr:Asp23/Gls24 family envelope stress response protein [Anaerolineae bacterium]